MIRFTVDGILADTEDEQLQFYDLVCAGDPVVLGHIAIWGQQAKDARGG